MKDVLECYRILDLTPGVTAEQVRKAYVELAHVWHPDRFVQNPVLRARAKGKMEEIDEAYRTISHFLPDLRKQDGSEEVDMPVKVLEAGSSLSPEVGPPLRYTILAVVVGAVLIVALAALVLLLRGRATGVPTSLPG